MMDPTQRGDEVAAVMREYYETNKPLHWWQRRRRYESECADDLMVGLLCVALDEWNARAASADALVWSADEYRLALNMRPMTPQQKCADSAEGREAALEWAEGLITQLPKHHNGRNSWLLNFGQSEEAKVIQEIRRERDEANGQFGVGA